MGRIFLAHAMSNEHLVNFRLAILRGNGKLKDVDRFDSSDATHGRVLEF